MTKQSLKIIFFGNTKYSLIGAKILHEKLGLLAIVTISQSPVAKFAKEQNIPLILTKKLDHELVDKIQKLNPDFFVVEDYGLILPDELLSIPKVAPLNIHHSFLPKFRGPTPAPAAILSGEQTTGVTIIKMESKVDAGDILAQVEYEMKHNETQDSLLTVLNELGANLMVDVIKNFETITPIPQPENDNNYTSHLTRQSGFIDLQNPPTPQVLGRMIRAYFPWPGVWTKMKLTKDSKEKIVKFLPKIDQDPRHSDPQLNLEKESSEDRILLQVEGKTPMTIKDFLNGYPGAKEEIAKLFP